MNLNTLAEQAGTSRVPVLIRRASVVLSNLSSMSDTPVNVDVPLSKALRQADIHKLAQKYYDKKGNVYTHATAWIYTGIVLRRRIYVNLEGVKVTGE